MDTFSQAGEGILLAQDGQRQIAQALAATLNRWLASFKAWAVTMPTSLPPTESRR